ncbi:MAG: DeoR/GlpR family DNA-binding transcription regulator [Clostridiales Family XIII bacterium]|jgi:DeoR/GlpR family transcriptional regulator of sugar metabolism|nr:DeoR/GlpR family DNA-binding transcription regulator [Clostridiales Family XIII bacterium]
MLSIQRRNEIKNKLWAQRSVTVSELAEHFNVSRETIRRDFDALEAEGFLTKAYGGAMLKKRVKSEANYEVLSEIFVENKQRIAKKAADFIYPGECIFLDCSTTVMRLVHEIKERSLIVITNSFKVLQELTESSNIKLISIGGELNLKTYAFEGRLAEQYISHFHLDKAFISCRALSIQKGLSDKDEEEAWIHRAVIENANAVYLLADHNKFDKVTFMRICDFDNITGVITDFKLPEEWKEFFHSKNIAFYECGALDMGKDLEI